MSYHKSSIELMKKIPKQIQKENHIQFTDPTLIQKIISIVLRQDFNPKTILEPSCGSGEFLYVLQQNFPHSDIVGIDKTALITDSIQDHFLPHVTIEHKNFFRIQRKFDLIIGWPPFCVMKKSDVPREQTPFMEGRPNSSILFLLHAMDLIESNGIIAFILPVSFLCGLAYKTIRQIIYNHYHIISIFLLEEKGPKSYIVFIIGLHEHSFH